MATIDEIKQQAEAVKNATQVGENTAERVGGALAGLADIAKQQDSKLSDLNKKIDDFNSFNVSPHNKVVEIDNNNHIVSSIDDEDISR